MKAITKDFDLYGIEVAKLMLMSKGYTCVSYREKSVPGYGSPTKRLRDIVFNDDLIVKKTIHHKNDEITIVTNKAYFKFFKQITL